MRIVILFFFSVLVAAFGQSQDVKETASKFWVSVDSLNHQEIIKYGSVLIEYIEKSEFKLDSTIVQIRLYTARSYANIGKLKKALELDLELNIKGYQIGFFSV